jgi:hypothetical protein
MPAATFASPAVSSATSAPVVSPAGGVTVKVARCSSPLPLKVTFCVAGSTFHPSGAISLIVPFVAPKLFIQVVTGRGFDSGKR